MGGFGEDEASVVDVHVCEDDGGAEQDETVQQKFVLQIDDGHRLVSNQYRISRTKPERQLTAHARTSNIKCSTSSTE